LDRFSLFIDAGYLNAGGRVANGLPRGAPLRVEGHPLISQLVCDARGHSSLDVLRAYWYDAATDAVATPAQREIARLRSVKLRLGRLVNGRQKGVDALVIRDLMTLARERAIAAAYLVSGDEDLREGVLAAQDMGVQVFLVGFPSSPDCGQAQTLIEGVRRSSGFPQRVVDALSPARMSLRSVPPRCHQATPRRGHTWGASFGAPAAFPAC
jgi:hypothetical protein